MKRAIVRLVALAGFGLVLLVQVLLAQACFAQATAHEPAPPRFDGAGKFRIVQLTDLHYIHGDGRSDGVLEHIDEVLDAERPDLVMLTGDIIYGPPAAQGYRAVLERVARREIPLAVVFGNHDDEQGLSREQLFAIVRSVPGNLTGTEEGWSGVTNFNIPVMSADGREVAAVVYGFDSNSYSRVDGVGGYDHIRFDQIAGYRARSAARTRENGGVAVPSVAFVHIPPPEFGLAAADSTARMRGTHGEKVCAPELNSGMVASMREMGDVVALFAGHDHDNDFAVEWKGMLLAYGRYSGGGTVYNNLGPRGARVIELTQGSRRVETWIRLEGGEVVQRVVFPDDFVDKQ